MEFVPSSRMVDDALRFMRVPPDEGRALAGSVMDMFIKLESYVRPRSVWGRFPISCFDGVKIGNDLKKLLSRSRDCYLMAVTIGHEADRGIALAQKRGMLEGVTMDACASVRADALCDEAEAVIRAELGDVEGLTARFSPGYGDAPLSLSEDIISLLDATRRIGLSMTRSMMMTPVKSVTAVAGVTAAGRDEPVGVPRCGPSGADRCGVCRMSGECPYRQI